MEFKGFNLFYNIDDVFDVDSGKRITEEQVYNNKGELPIVTSKTSQDGITWWGDETWLRDKGDIFNEPVVTWTKEGYYAGTIFYRDYPFFPIDVCGILKVKDSFKNKINLEWFVYTRQNNFYKNVYSNAIQGKLYQETVVKIKFKLIDINKQDLICKSYKKATKLKENISKLILEIQTFLQNKLVYRNYEQTDIRIHFKSKGN